MPISDERAFDQDSLGQQTDNTQLAGARSIVANYLRHERLVNTMLRSVPKADN